MSLSNIFIQNNHSSIWLALFLFNYGAVKRLDEIDGKKNLLSFLLASKFFNVTSQNCFAWHHKKRVEVYLELAWQHRDKNGSIFLLKETWKAPNVRWGDDTGSETSIYKKQNHVIEVLYSHIHSNFNKGIHSVIKQFKNYWFPEFYEIHFVRHS